MTDIPSTSRVSATMLVVNEVKRAIQLGEYSVGDKLPNEADLAKRIGVGRSSFREGMRILATYGIVEIRQGEGTFVTNNFADQVFEFMGFLPNKENLIQVIQLRHIFEIGCIRTICCQGLNEQDYQELAGMVEKLEKAETLQERVSSDFAFHEKIVLSTENTFAVQIYRMMSKMLVAMMEQLMCYDDVFHDATQSHREILKALKEEDVQRSITTVDDHLNKVSAYAKQYIRD